MKFITLLSVFGMLFFSNPKINAQSKEKTIIATYKGMDVVGNYLFEDSKGNPINFFDESQSFESNLSLYDENLFGKKLVVTYKWIDVHLFNEDGEPTGEKMKVKRILNYKLR